MGATGITGTREPQPLNFITQQVSVLPMRPLVHVRARRQYTGSHDQIVIIYKYLVKDVHRLGLPVGVGRGGYVVSTGLSGAMYESRGGSEVLARGPVRREAP